MYENHYFYLLFVGGTEGPGRSDGGDRGRASTTAGAAAVTTFEEEDAKIPEGLKVTFILKTHYPQHVQLIDHWRAC